MTTASVDARLRDIEAGLERWGSSYGGSAYAAENLAWLVAIVRRYREALDDGLSWAVEARTRDTLGTMDACVMEIDRTLREALNSEATD